MMIVNKNRNTLHGRLWMMLVIIGVLAELFIGPVAHPARAQDRSSPCEKEELAVSLPLTELGNQEYVRMDGKHTGFSGGLYPDGSNQRPPEHEAAGLALAGQITPRAPNGSPDPQNGKIVLVSVGMSNANAEFNHFIKMVHKNPLVNPQLELVNGATPGLTADRWVTEDAPGWGIIDIQLRRKDLTAAQVQAAWVKNTLRGMGDFPVWAQDLQAHLEIIARELHERFPNLKIVYFSSRTRSYSVWRGLGPEPGAYETGFSVKWMIEKQISGDPTLNYDPARGEVVAPYLSWGPYLWINGTSPRADGRIWGPEDMAPDCVHPSTQGAEKVAEQLFEFLMSDTTSAGWFSATGGAELQKTTQPPTLTDTASPIPPSASPTIESTPMPGKAQVTASPPGPTATPLQPNAPEAAEPGAPDWVIPALVGAFLLGAGGAWLIVRRRG
jgi:hypothetical protein